MKPRFRGAYHHGAETLRVVPDCGTGMSAAGVSLTHDSVPQPLRVIDPDHPLAALVRKARQDKNGGAAVPPPAPAPAPEEVTQPTVPVQPEYSTDREWSLFRTFYPHRGCMKPKQAGILNERFSGQVWGKVESVVILI